MPDTPSITLVKSFTYRGQYEEFSNTYHFSGTTPANRAAWKALADAMIVNEKACTLSTVNFVRAYGYEAGVDNSVAQIDYAGADAPIVAGTYGPGAGVTVPGDIAATVRWETPNFTSRGKRIYLRKYLHGVEGLGTDRDKLLTAQRTAIATWAATLIAGTLPGSVRYCGPQGAVASNPVVALYLTTRTLKRRGKRPSS